MKYDSIEQIPKHLRDQVVKKLGPDYNAGDTTLPGTPAAPGPKNGSKYRNVKIEVDGITFDSKAEARRYQELKLLEAAKDIDQLELQPVYELQPKFKDSKGKTHRAITYQADFEYWDGNAQVWVTEDVKGMETEAFKIKRKMFIYKYPDYELRITK